MMFSLSTAGLATLSGAVRDVQDTASSQQIPIVTIEYTLGSAHPKALVVRRA